MVSAEDTASKIIKEHGKVCDTYKHAKEYAKACKNEPKDLDGDAHQEWETRCQQAWEDLLTNLLEDYRIMARKEFEYHESEEYINELMDANGYTFTKDGKRFG